MNADDEEAIGEGRDDMEILAASAGRRVNHPLPDDDPERATHRLLGWAVPYGLVGLSRGMALLERVEELMREAGRSSSWKAEAETARKQVEHLEAMRPHWAQGYTSDGVAAQCTAAALSALWRLLGTDNQTAAMQALRKLIAGREEAAALTARKGYETDDVWVEPQGWTSTDVIKVVEKDGARPTLREVLARRAEIAPPASGTRQGSVTDGATAPGDAWGRLLDPPDESALSWLRLLVDRAGDPADLVADLAEDAAAYTTLMIEATRAVEAITALARERPTAPPTGLPGTPAYGSSGPNEPDSRNVAGERERDLIERARDAVAADRGCDHACLSQDGDDACACRRQARAVIALARTAEGGRA